MVQCIKAADLSFPSVLEAALLCTAAVSILVTPGRVWRTLLRLGLLNVSLILGPVIGCNRVRKRSGTLCFFGRLSQEFESGVFRGSPQLWSVFEPPAWLPRCRGQGCRRAAGVRASSSWCETRRRDQRPGAGMRWRLAQGSTSSGR